MNLAVNPFVAPAAGEGDDDGWTDGGELGGTEGGCVAAGDLADGVNLASIIGALKIGSSQALKPIATKPKTNRRERTNIDVNELTNIEFRT